MASLNLLNITRCWTKNSVPPLSDERQQRIGTLRKLYWREHNNSSSNRPLKHHLYALKYRYGTPIIGPKVKRFSPGGHGSNF